MGQGISSSLDYTTDGTHTFITYEIRALDYTNSFSAGVCSDTIACSGTLRGDDHPSSGFDDVSARVTYNPDNDDLNSNLNFNPNGADDYYGACTNDANQGGLTSAVFTFGTAVPGAGIVKVGSSTGFTAGHAIDLTPAAHKGDIEDAAFTLGVRLFEDTEAATNGGNGFIYWPGSMVSGPDLWDDVNNVPRSYSGCIAIPNQAFPFMSGVEYTVGSYNNPEGNTINGAALVVELGQPNESCRNKFNTYITETGRYLQTAFNNHCSAALDAALGNSNMTAPTSISLEPSSEPSQSPSQLPSQETSNDPSNEPSTSPSSTPSSTPSQHPSTAPSDTPSASPSQGPTLEGSESPSSDPSKNPSSSPAPSMSVEPSKMPSISPRPSESFAPSSSPSGIPSGTPSKQPSSIPSDSPSKAPSQAPSGEPSDLPSSLPSDSPSRSPRPYQAVRHLNRLPSQAPSGEPSDPPSSLPSDSPSRSPSSIPSGSPSKSPSQAPSGMPSVLPSRSPSSIPSGLPTSMAPAGGSGTDLPDPTKPSDRPSCTPVEYTFFFSIL